MKKKRIQQIAMLIKALVAISLISWGIWSIYQTYSPKNTPTTATSQNPMAVGEPTKKTTEEKAAYTAPAGHPRQLIVPSLAIDANILPMGTKDGAVEAPTSAWDVGWYNISALPGAEYGSMILDGHVNDTLNGPGIFYSISRMASGDIITVEKGDLQRINYHVTSVEQVSKDEVNIAELMQSPARGLHLITCGGQYDETKKTYDDRIIVTAVRT